MGLKHFTSWFCCAGDMKPRPSKANLNLPCNLRERTLYFVSWLVKIDVEIKEQSARGDIVTASGGLEQGPKLVLATVRPPLKLLETNN